MDRLIDLSIDGMIDWLSDWSYDCFIHLAILLPLPYKKNNPEQKQVLHLLLNLHHNLQWQHKNGLSKDKFYSVTHISITTFNVFSAYLYAQAFCCKMRLHKQTALHQLV